MARKHKYASDETPALSLYAEGNNGGDYLQMEMLDDGLVRIEVGHCCIKTGPKVVPIELLTAVLFSAVSGNWHKTLDAIAWPSDYKAELKAKAEAAK